MLTFIIWMTYRCPNWIVFGLGVMFGYLGIWFSSRNSRVVDRNLQLCFPQWNRQTRSQLAKRLIKHNASLSKEFAVAWLGERKMIESYITEIRGESIVQAAQQNAKPLIIAVPHIGNWEFFWHWLQLHYPAISMYSPAQYPKLDQLMLNARKQFGGRPFATDSKGMMGLLRALKQGGIMMILPDQVPKNEGAVFAPFFGQTAYTMTLVHKFVEKTGAELCFGACVRASNGFYRVEIEKAEFELTGSSVEQFCQAMNAQLEKIIVRHPEQYQWNYKRFKRQPDGSDIYC